MSLSRMSYPVLRADEIENRRVRKQLWYKERVVETIHKRLLADGKTDKFLCPKDWTFVKHGMDDFRSGLPPTLKEDLLVRGRKGLEPNVKGLLRDNPTQKVKTGGQLTKQQMCFSKVLPSVKSKRDLVDKYEWAYLQHPLGVFDYYENAVDAETLDKIVQMLDPELCASVDENLARAAPLSSASHSAEERRSEERDYGPSASASTHTNETSTPVDPMRDILSDAARNPYRWIPKLSDGHKSIGNSVLEVTAEERENAEHIESVAREFCDFIRNLGGNENNVEENTIHSLFASGYETKPALNVPIHLVDPRNIPAELYSGEPATMPGAEQGDSAAAAKTLQTGFKKFSYGAWYLPKPLWKKRDAEQPLLDPDGGVKMEVNETRAASLKLDAELAQMHGARAFLKYVDSENSKRKRCPSFLTRVKQLQGESAPVDEVVAADDPVA